MTMNKANKRRYHKKAMSKKRLVISVIAYYIQQYIPTVCIFAGFGLVALGLILLYIDIPTAIMLITFGACLITVRIAFARAIDD